jgi:TonB family protein
MKSTAISLILMFSMALASPTAAQQNQDPVYEAGQGVTLPKVTKAVKPYYDAASMQDRIEGNVLLTCVVSKAGVPTEIEVTRSLDERLDAQAIHALEQWQFHPGQKDGEAVAVRIAVEMNFTLK